MDRRRHRRRQEHEQRAAAELGVRRPRRRARCGGSYSPAKDAKLPRSALPVYKRQRFPDPVLGEQYPQGETVYENDGVRLWHDGDEVAVVSFKTKMHTVSDQVLDGLQEAVGRAERDGGATMQ